MDNKREEQYKQAIEYYKKTPDASINKTAKKFSVKAATLSKRLKAQGICTNRRHVAEVAKEQSFLDYYKKSGLDVSACADKFGYSRGGAYLILHRNNVVLNSLKNKQETQKRVDLAVEYYASNPMVSIVACAEKHNISRWLLKEELAKKKISLHNEVLVRNHGKDFLLKKKNNCWTNINTVNDTFFSSIDTEEKAYWLGFILADGYVSKRGSVRIALQIRDYDHLHRFKKAVGATVKIKEYEAKLSTTGKSYPTCSIEFHSAQIIKDLARNNIFNCKSKKEQPSELVPESLIRHYIRGFFDGDGWISQWDRENGQFPRFEVGFGSSKQFLQYLVKKIKEQTGVCFGEVRPFSSIYKTSLRNQKDMITFVKYLYQNCHVYLPRKYEKALELCRLHSTTIEE